MRLKLEANRQRRGVEGLSQLLPADLASTLQSAQTIFVTDTQRAVFPYHPLGHIASDVAYDSPDRPSDFFFKRFGWEYKFHAALPQVPKVHGSKLCYLHLAGEGAYPVFIVPLGWAQTHLLTLVQNVAEDVSAATLDGQQGIYTCVWCGYVEEDWGPEEDVYILTIFGHGAVNLAEPVER